jgi:hypothetical protein
MLAFAALLSLSPLAAGAISGPSTTPAPPQGYKLQESMLVPVMNAGGVTSRKPLLAGKTYVLRVTGTLYVGVGALGPGFGDAEYGFYKSGQVIDKCRDGVDLGVGINDTSVSPGHAKRPRWGAYRANHLYTQRIPGTGARLDVDYHDCFYPDNRPNLHSPGTGGLKLWIYAPLAEGRRE